MAVDLGKLVSKQHITLDDLSNKVIAIDAYNVLYQFLSNIRQPDGTPLMDSHGNVTSHLSGMFYRTIEFLNHGIQPIYVFDGIPSMLKQKTIAARMRRREEARDAWSKALEKGDMETALKHAHASTRIDEKIINSTKTLLDQMGIGHINAPSEGEAEASELCKQGLVYAVSSQDYDTLLLGAPLIVRNLAITGRRKLPGKNIFVKVETELVSLEATLSQLGLSQRQLIWAGIMLGTDFNDGVRGIGPKTALKVAKSINSIEEMVEYVKANHKTEFELDVKEVEALFLHPEVKRLDKRQVEALLTAKPDKNGIIDFMCNQHGFDKERISKYADQLIKTKGSPNQKGINAWM